MTVCEWCAEEAEASPCPDCEKTECLDCGSEYWVEEVCPYCDPDWDDGTEDDWRWR